jgi:hypothetical protein
MKKYFYCPLHLLTSKNAYWETTKRGINRWHSDIFLRIVLFLLVIWFSTNPSSIATASQSSFAISLASSSTPDQRLNHATSSVQEYSYQEQSEIKGHVFKFYLDNAVAPDIEFAKAVLPKYVEDMNSILAKNTNRRLIFNPETDIIITTTQPFSNQASHPLPVENFEIWAYAILSTQPYSYGGYAGIDVSGAGVLAGLKWSRLYDPDTLESGEAADYWTQINNMLHELAHVFGAGMGEYYKLSTIQDTTGIAPLLNINVFDSNDSFWSSKPDFMADPLLRNATQEGLTNREALLDYVEFSALTSTIMSGNYRNDIPTIDLQNIIVKVDTGNGVPISNANIKIWSIVGNSPYQAQLLVDDYTDSDGQISFAWGGSQNPHNNYDFLRLIKVYKDGFIASAKYVSIFDADIAKLVDEDNKLQISIPLSYGTFLPLIQN